MCVMPRTCVAGSSRATISSGESRHRELADRRIDVAHPVDRFARRVDHLEAVPGVAQRGGDVASRSAGSRRTPTSSS